MRDAPAAVSLAREVAEAHAAHLLAAADTIDVSFSSGGLAFAMKRQSEGLTRAHARLSPLRQEIDLTGDVPRPWNVSVGSSDELKRRLDELHSGLRRWRWTPEELGVFAAGALWTYVAMPLLLDGAEQLTRMSDVGGRRRLRVTLPAWVAGHGRVQTLHIQPNGLIGRHDYTASAFGSWARAAQEITSYDTFDSVPIGTMRRVTPRLVWALPSPTLVWIRVDAVRLQRPEPSVQRPPQVQGEPPP